MSNIIINIEELIESREQKEKELKFYRKKLKELEFKVSFLQRDIQITNKIIEIIEEEKVVEVNPE